MVRSGTFEELVAGSTPEVTQLAKAARELFTRLHPEATEVIYLGYHSASYGLGPKKIKEGYGYIMPQKDRINLGLYHGAQLPDPEGLLEGSGAKLRHVKIRTMAELKNPALATLIQAGIEERRNALSS